MNENLDLTEILKDCPKGVELYSPIYGLGILTKVTNRIHVKFPKEHNVKCFRPDGKVSEDGKIMLFPKGKTTWEGFQRPFVDGDVIVWDNRVICLFSCNRNDCIISHFSIHISSKLISENVFYGFGTERFATEEEKQLLFNAIKENGYEWDVVNKELKKNDPKFDISTLQPFDKVLVRYSDNDWTISLFSYVDETRVFGAFVCNGGVVWKQCVPYNEETKHLLGTSQQAPDKYITWE